MIEGASVAAAGGADPRVGTAAGLDAGLVPVRLGEIGGGGAGAETGSGTCREAGSAAEEVRLSLVCMKLSLASAVYHATCSKFMEINTWIFSRRHSIPFPEQNSGRAADARGTGLSHHLRDAALSAREVSY